MATVDALESSSMDGAIRAVLDAPDLDTALRAARRLFVERLDFDPADGAVPMPDRETGTARQIARRDGVHVVALVQDAPGRVGTAAVRKALAELRRLLSGDLLLLATNSARSEWHLVYPTVSGGRDVLRRLVLYKGQPFRTVAERLGGMYQDAERRGLRAALEAAYDVEAVTRTFFQEYRRVFEHVEAMLQTPFDRESTRLFCQTLFNRLMFLYFLQRKGWLTYDGNPAYLEALWRAAKQEGVRNFYSERLELLFFTALNNERTGNWESYRQVVEPLIGHVPFLNGGLFEKGPLDRADVTVPDEAIDLILHGLFARFNFTITESTPYDVEVAVDPEMLGKVFEELVTGRHETGSYYTPRPIVAFMCREGLKGHLLDRVQGLSTEAASAFVDGHDVSRLTVQQARQALDALETVAAVDPACGSGAYLLGMLHELVELQRLLYSSELISDSKSLYELKLRVIERNVYGVDLDRFAVNTAMLRLWLSLAVDFDGGVDDVPPLPNLAFKILQGDAVLAPNPREVEHTASNIFRYSAHEQARELAQLKAEYMRETGEEKRVLEERIRGLQADLKAMLSHSPAPEGSVDWRAEFAEVFDANGGFDVVLANPPYVRQELIREIKPALQRTYGGLYSGTADLYVYFYYRALQLLRPGGMLVFISSNKWFRANYGAKLRAHIADTAHVLSITDFGDLPVFESATAYPMIFIAQTGEHHQPAAFTQVRSLQPPYPDVLALVREQGQMLPEDAISGSDWSLTDSGSRSRLQRMRLSGVTLGEYVNGQIYRGILTGFNEAFVIDGAKRAELIAADPKSEEIIKPFAGGRDIKRWRIDAHDRWLIFTRRGVDIDQYPAIKSHLRRWQAELTPKLTGTEDNGRKPGRYKWYEIQDEIAYYRAFEQPKIVFPEIAREPRFAIDTTDGLVDTTVYIIPTENLYLLAVLNSQATYDLYSEISAEIRGGYLRYKRQYVTRVPIPTASPADREAVAELAQQCLDARGQGPEVAEWEAEINERVAVLYGLAGVQG